MATEQQAERAIKILKRMIDAAENSNQAGEDAVCKAAAAIDLYSALEFLKAYVGIQAGSDPNAFPYMERADKALAKARGEQS